MIYVNEILFSVAFPHDQDMPLENENNKSLLLDSEIVDPYHESDDSRKDPDYVDSNHSGSDSDDVPLKKLIPNHVTAESDDSIAKTNQIAISKKRGRKVVAGDTREIRNRRKKLKNLREEYIWEDNTRQKIKRASSMQNKV